jgi:hypothetical protein
VKPIGRKRLGIGSSATSNQQESCEDALGVHIKSRLSTSMMKEPG